MATIHYNIYVRLRDNIPRHKGFVESKEAAKEYIQELSQDYLESSNTRFIEDETDNSIKIAALGFSCCPWCSGCGDPLTIYYEKAIPLK